MPGIETIRRALASYRPETLGAARERRAAVALVLRNGGDGPELLFIERAEHDGDPWSGHMAFPGGRVDPGDADARGAAERETREEVGLDLRDAERLGRLDDLSGTRAAGVPRLVVSAFVYHLGAAPHLVTNHEVRQAFWFPLRELQAPERRVEHPISRRTGMPFPGILVGEAERHVVWGLTYRFLEGFFALLGRPLPDRWQADEANSG